MVLCTTDMRCVELICVIVLPQRCRMLFLVLFGEDWVVMCEILCIGIMVDFLFNVDV